MKFYRSINYIATKLPKFTIHGFDSFEGLPEDWRDGFPKGTFSTDLPEVAKNVSLHKGWFSETIPPFLSKYRSSRPQVAYLHIDCDLYSSTRDIFELLGQSIGRGTVITFDEYFNYDGWKDGEFLAFKHFREENGLSYRYLAYNYLGEQVAVIVE